MGHDLIRVCALALALIFTCASMARATTSITLNNSSGGPFPGTAIIFVLTGVDTTTPIDKHTAGTYVGSGTSCTSAAVTPTAANDALIVAGFTQTAKTGYSTTPSTTVTSYDSTASAVYRTLAGASMHSGTSSITGTLTFSNSDNQCNIIAFNPSGGSDPTVVVTYCVGSSAPGTGDMVCPVTAFSPSVIFIAGEFDAGAGPTLVGGTTIDNTNGLGTAWILATGTAPVPTTIFPVSPGAGASPGGRPQGYNPIFERLVRGPAWV